MSKGENNILALFYGNEKKIENLYKSYSLKFPDHKHLWDKLVIKKRYQEDILNDLNLRLESHKLFKPNGYSGQILNYISNFIDQQLIKLNQGNIFIQEALIVALRLERSLKEKESLKLLEPMHDEVFKIFKTINHLAEQNANLLISAYNQVLINIKRRVNSGDPSYKIIFKDEALINYR